MFNSKKLCDVASEMLAEQVKIWNKVGPREKSSLMSTDCATRIGSFRQISHWITQLHCSVTWITLMAGDLQRFLSETSVNYRPLSPNISVMGLTKAFLLENWEDLTSGNRVVNNMWQQTWSVRAEMMKPHTNRAQRKKRGRGGSESKNDPFQLKIWIVGIMWVNGLAVLSVHPVLIPTNCLFDGSKQTITH